MKHTTSRIIFAYWDALRGERPAPERSEIRPGEIRHVLADTVVLGRDAGGGYDIRLVGSRINALFGRNLTGTGFGRLWDAQARPEIDAILAIVGEEALGAAIGIRGRNENGSDLAMEAVLLPLRHNGRTDSRMLGALSPASLPSWAGLVPMRSLAVASYRMVEAKRPSSGPEFVPMPRHRFRVFEGGLA